MQISDKRIMKMKSSHIIRTLIIAVGFGLFVIISACKEPKVVSIHDKASAKAPRPIAIKRFKFRPDVVLVFICYDSQEVIKALVCMYRSIP